MSMLKLDKNSRYNRTKLQDLKKRAKITSSQHCLTETIIVLLNTAPTAEELPEIDIDAIKDAIESGKDVEIIDGKVIAHETKPTNVDYKTRIFN